MSSAGRRPHPHTIRTNLSSPLPDGVFDIPAVAAAHYNGQFSVAFSMEEQEQMCGRNRAVRMSFVSLWCGCCRIKFRAAGRPPRCLLRNTISV